MRKLLEKFENKQPEIVFEWKDSETEAEGEPESITEINKEDLSPDAYPGPSQ